MAWIEKSLDEESEKSESRPVVLPADEDTLITQEIVDPIRVTFGAVQLMDDLTVGNPKTR